MCYNIIRVLKKEVISLSRFSGGQSSNNKEINLSKGNYPFKNVYATKEGEYIYLNMEADEKLSNRMTTKKDMYVVVDISGSMRRYYEEKVITKVSEIEPTGFMGKIKKSIGIPTYKKEIIRTEKSEISMLLTRIIDSISPFDDDGVDVFFFSTDLINSGCISSAEEVDELINDSMKMQGAFCTTNPIQCFKAITNQIKEKKRGGVVFFLTDGIMDDSGVSLKNYYKDVLHRELTTRDNFYCYAIEFGNDASGALDMLNGLYAPEGGPEDLFDKENINSLFEISEVLVQVGGMSAIGGEDKMSISVTEGMIDTINTDLINPAISANPYISKIMSFRIKANNNFSANIRVSNYDTMKIDIELSQYEAKVMVRN